jgi:hypothetical protein
MILQSLRPMTQYHKDFNGLEDKRQLEFDIFLFFTQNLVVLKNKVLY